MANIKEVFGTSNQAITITITSLASSLTVGRASTAVDNTTNLFLETFVMVKVKTSASALANDKGVYVYGYATADGGTTYTDSITGTDAGFTRTDPTNLPLLGFINCPATSTTYVGGPWAVAALCYGGVLPAKWGIFVANFTGQALDASVGNAFYQGAYSSVA